MINYCLFPHGQVFSLGIRLTRLTIPRSANSFKEVFLFSHCSLCGIVLEFGFLQYPKSCVFTLRRRNGNCLVSVVWKITTCWLFGDLFLRANHGRRSASLRWRYMANREWGFLIPMSPCANREGWRETAFPLPLFWLLL